MPGSGFKSSSLLKQPESRLKVEKDELSIIDSDSGINSNESAKEM